MQNNQRRAHAVSIGVAALVFAGAVLLLCLRTEKLTPKQHMQRFLAQNATLLAQLVDEAQGDWFSPETATSPALKQAFRSRGVASISGRSEDGSVWVGFDWAYALITEGSIYLRYIPANAYTVASHHTEALLVSQTEDTWHWTGIGMGGMGYILVERLQEGWFYEEIYCPT